MYLDNKTNEIFHFFRSIQYNIIAKKSPSLPHLMKREVIKHYAQKYKINAFIETGTYKGDMIHGLQKIFEEIHSIELSSSLYKKALQRFSAQSHIHLYCGDSKILLPDIIDKLNCSLLFWLDAHYSGGITASGDQESPILDELNTIFSHPVENHIVLIDDARCFNGSNGYPTIEELFHLVNINKPGWNSSVYEDIIRLEPKIQVM